MELGVGVVALDESPIYPVVVGILVLKLRQRLLCPLLPASSPAEL